MLYSGKKFRALRDKKKNSNSRVVRNFFLNEAKNHNPPFKLNGRSLIGIVSTYLHKYQYLQNKYIYYFTFIVPSIYDFIIKLGAAMAVVE